MTETEDQDEAAPAAPLPSIEPLLTIEDVAALLKTSKTAVYGLMRVGSLPFVKLGNSRRVHPDDLRQFYRTGGRLYPVRDTSMFPKRPPVAAAAEAVE